MMAACGVGRREAAWLGEDEVLRQLVDEGYALRARIAVMQERLEAYELELKALAAERPHEHIGLRSATSHGTQWVARGSGCEVRVLFPQDRLAEKLRGGTACVDRLRSLCGACFEHLFEPVVHYVPVKGFRRRAEEMLGEDAHDLMRACSAPSAPRVLWKEER